jgi:RNA polymerase sigma-54 factor
MVLLQHKLSVKLSQRQILTPGLVQMVSVLALNKLELKDMITAEMVENPVLEELEDSVPLLDEVGKKEEDRERAAAATNEENPITAVEKKDPFEEIDFGSFFQDYLDPGYRTHSEMEDIERPSFENFLSKPSNLTDHLSWQLGALSLRREVREAADLIIGNLNEDGYLIASDDELLGVAPPATPEADAVTAKNIVSEAQALGLAEVETDSASDVDSLSTSGVIADSSDVVGDSDSDAAIDSDSAYLESPILPADYRAEASYSSSAGNGAAAVAPAPDPVAHPVSTYKPGFSAADLQEALQVVQQLDPPGVGCRDLRECLLAQLRFHQAQLEQHKNGNGTVQVLLDAMAVVDNHLRGLQNKQHKEIGRAIGRPIEAVQAALDYIRTLDPRPGLRYNKVQARLIEPDVAFVKHGDEWLVIMNDEDLPQLRLNPAYKKLDARLRERALQERHPADQEHRAAQADHHQSLLFDCRPPTGIPRKRHRSTQTHDDQGGGRRDRRASFNGKPCCGQQIRPHTARCIRVAIFLQRERTGTRGWRHLTAHPQTPCQEAHRGRRSQPSVDRRADHSHPAVAGHPGDPPYSGQIPRRYAHPQYTPAQSKEIDLVIV